MEHQVSLNMREWTLVRVALLTRMARLQALMYDPDIIHTTITKEAWNKQLQRSLEESKELLNGKLSIWKE